MAKHDAIAAGYDDALMLDWRGFVAEATGANFFMYDGKNLLTPTPDCFLDGITRQTIISLARDKGVPVFEQHIAFEDLKRAREVFLTGTAAEITPIREVEDLAFRPGEITSVLMKAYSELTSRASDAPAA